MQPHHQPPPFARPLSPQASDPSSGTRAPESVLSLATVLDRTRSSTNRSPFRFFPSFSSTTANNPVPTAPPASGFSSTGVTVGTLPQRNAGGASPILPPRYPSSMSSITTGPTAFGLSRYTAPPILLQRQPGVSVRDTPAPTFTGEHGIARPVAVLGAVNETTSPSALPRLSVPFVHAIQRRQLARQMSDATSEQVNPERLPSQPVTEDTGQATDRSNSADTPTRLLEIPSPPTNDDASDPIDSDLRTEAAALDQRESTSSDDNTDVAVMPTDPELQIRNEDEWPNPAENSRAWQSGPESHTIDIEEGAAGEATAPAMGEVDLTITEQHPGQIELDEGSHPAAAHNSSEPGHEIRGNGSSADALDGTPSRTSDSNTETHTNVELVLSIEPPAIGSICPMQIVPELATDPDVTDHAGGHPGHFDIATNVLDSLPAVTGEIAIEAGTDNPVEKLTFDSVLSQTESANNEHQAFESIDTINDSDRGTTQLSVAGTCSATLERAEEPSVPSRGCSDNVDNGEALLLLCQEADRDQNSDEQIPFVHEMLYLSREEAPIASEPIEFEGTARKNDDISDTVTATDQTACEEIEPDTSTEVSEGDSALSKEESKSTEHEQSIEIILPVHPPPVSAFALYGVTASTATNPTALSPALPAIPLPLSSLSASTRDASESSADATTSEQSDSPCSNLPSPLTICSEPEKPASAESPTQRQNNSTNERDPSWQSLVQQVGYDRQGSIWVPKRNEEMILTVSSSKEPPSSSYPISQRTGIKRRLSDDLELAASRRISGNESEPVKKPWLEEGRQSFNQNRDERATIPANGLPSYLIFELAMAAIPLSFEQQASPLPRISSSPREVRSTTNRKRKRGQILHPNARPTKPPMQTYQSAVPRWDDFFDPPGEREE